MPLYTLQTLLFDTEYGVEKQSFISIEIHVPLQTLKSKYLINKEQSQKSYFTRVLVYVNVIILS